MAQASNNSASVTVESNHKIQRINTLTDMVERYDESDASTESDNSLTNLWSAIKNLEDAAEELRKEAVEPEMESRVNPGERLSGVHRIQSHRKYVEEDVGTVVGRAGALGIDWTEFVSLKASTIASNYPDLTTVGRNEYTYFR